MNYALLSWVLAIPALVAAQSSRNASSLEPVVGIGRSTIDREHRTGPAGGLRVVLASRQQISVGLIAGFGLSATGWRWIDHSNDNTRSVSTALPEELIRNADREPTVGRLAFALGFLGPDVTVYFAEGDLRPYAGLGAQLVLFPYAGSLGTAIAPHVRAGLDVRLHSGLSAFLEVRHAVGLSQLASPSGKSFDEFSMVALGISFFPRFN
jgi:hypothetical protein